MRVVIFVLKSSKKGGGKTLPAHAFSTLRGDSRGQMREPSCFPTLITLGRNLAFSVLRTQGQVLLEPGCSQLTQSCKMSI